MLRRPRVLAAAILVLGFATTEAYESIPTSVPRDRSQARDLKEARASRDPLRSTKRPISPPIARDPRTSLFNAASAETTWFGGTCWAADSMRWEAIEDSVWTFESGVGSHFDMSDPDVQPYAWPKHARMEGWVGRDPSYPWPPDDPRFRRMTGATFGASVPCVGAAAGLGGDASFWLGLTQAEAESRLYATGQGYGNAWRGGAFDGVERSFQYPGSGDVTLSYDYVCEIEPSFDYAYVEVIPRSTGIATTVRAYTGSSSGHDAVVLSPGGALPSGPDSITVRMSVWTDGSYSDQDGLFPTTCGAFAFDNVELAGAIQAGPFTFETDAEGWVSPARPPSADRADIRDLSDLPSPTVSPCGLEDSVLVFFNGENVEDLALSPWIDLGRAGVAGRPGRLLEASLFWPAVNSPSPEVIVTAWAQWKPYGGRPVASPLTWNQSFYAFGASDFCSPAGAPVRIDLGDLIDPEATEVRIAIGLRRDCPPLTPCADTTKTIYVDNVRFGAWGQVTGVPGSPPVARARLLSPSPNPFSRTATFRFTLPPGESRHVALRLFDVVGRPVRELASARFDPGEHAVPWDGREVSGGPATPGIYFLMLAVDGRVTDTRKIVRLP